MTQSNWSTPSADRFDQRRRVADAHQVPRPVGRQVGEGGGQRRQHLGPGLADAEPADAVAVEVELGRSPAPTRRAARRPMPPWTMPNSAWSSRRWAARAWLGPRRRALDRQPDHVWRRRQRRADVEHHLDVGAEQLLHADGALRREPVGRAVVGAAEGDAVVVDLRLEREHLVPAGVGERQARASRRSCPSPPKSGDRLRAWAQHQVVGVAEHDLDAERAVVGRGEVLDRATRADRHEARRAIRRRRPCGRCRRGPRRRRAVSSNRTGCIRGSGRAASRRRRRGTGSRRRAPPRTAGAIAARRTRRSSSAAWCAAGGSW